MTGLMLAVLVMPIACGGPQDGGTETPPPAETPEETPAPAASEWEKDGLKVYPLEGTPQFPDASLALDGLADGAELASGTVAFDFTVGGYELGTQTAGAGENGLANSGDGQHIHLILNNGPYSAHYGPSFEKELEDGRYVMLAFLSRSWHESVKEPAAAVVKQFTVGDGSATDPADLSAQHLFYSRPKGTYVGADTEKLMLDFFLLNTELSADGNKVRATINGSEFVFSEWVPYVIEGLPKGEATITLELIDATGAPIPGPFNNVTRTVTLEEAPAAEG